MVKYLIQNSHVVNENKIEHLDVYIKDGRICEIGKNIDIDDETVVIDGKDKYLLPGMIDDQVHFREPGLTHKADIESESKAAVAGGITSYMEMPNCTPATTNLARIKEKKDLAADKSHANYAFYLGATNDNLQDIINVDKNEVCGVKVFMGASTGNMLVDDPEILDDIFKQCPVLIATHCESTPMIEKNESHYKSLYGKNIPMTAHSSIRSAEACYTSSSFAVSLAKKHGTRLHVLHITTEKELELFTDDLGEKSSEKQITAEVCAHHLFFSQKDYIDKEGLIKCNPAIKLETDRLALLEAVNDDVIDIIATDHAPHLLSEKSNPYTTCPSGLPLVQHALVSLLEHYHRGIFTLEKIVQKACHSPADCYQVLERGYIKEGYWADLVLVDLNATDIVKNEDSWYKCKWSPFEGFEFHSKIIKTFVNGVLKYSDNKIINETKGIALRFDR